MVVYTSLGGNGSNIECYASLRLGAIEAQWFRLRPELEARDQQGDSPTLTVVGCHWGPVIPTRPELEAWDRGDSHTVTAVGYHWGTLIPTQPELEARDRGDSPTVTVVGCHWGPVIPTRPELLAWDIPLLFSNDSKGYFRCRILKYLGIPNYYFKGKMH
jgi:hypothetical protein